MLPIAGRRAFARDSDSDICRPDRALRATAGPAPVGAPYRCRSFAALRTTIRCGPLRLSLFALTLCAPRAPAQNSTDSTLDRLIFAALEQNSTLRAARDRTTASRARIAPAGTRPDPNLTAGLITIPIAKPSLTDDNFTMLMVGIEQSIPYPGKLALRTKAAALDAAAADATLATTRLALVRDVKAAYYELAFLDRALEIAERTRSVLADVIRLTETHYGTGSGTQQDVLKARVEAARLAETANMLAEARIAAHAQLNAALERPSDTPVNGATVSARLARAAVAEDAASIRFSAQSLGARAAGSPLPPVATLQAMAIIHSPMLREHEARIAAQASRVEVARQEYKPDFDVTVQYNHRVAYPDLLTAQVSIPLRFQKSAKQDQVLAETTAELSAMQAEHRAAVNAINARVATLASDIERSRTQLAIYVKAILPQGRAAVTSAIAGYQVGRSDLLTLLDLQNTVFTSETAYYRALSDFAKSIAELEQTVGIEVLP